MKYIIILGLLWLNSTNFVHTTSCGVNWVHEDTSHEEGDGHIRGTNSSLGIGYTRGKYRLLCEGGIEIKGEKMHGVGLSPSAHSQTVKVDCNNGPLRPGEFTMGKVDLSFGANLGVAGIFGKEQSCIIRSRGFGFGVNFAVGKVEAITNNNIEDITSAEYKMKRPIEGATIIAEYPIKDCLNLTHINNVNEYSEVESLEFDSIMYLKNDACPYGTMEEADKNDAVKLQGYLSSLGVESEADAEAFNKTRDYLNDLN
jgi:hypothetical protein